MKVVFRQNDGSTPQGTAGAAYDMSASFTGALFFLESMEGYSICAAFAGGGTGALKLQACNNPITDHVNLKPDPNAVWVDITGSAYAITADGSYFWNVSDVYYKAVRLVYTKTTGAGAMQVYYNAKGIQ